MIIDHTARLTLRTLNEADAEFILGLLNQPSWLEYIGDKGVRDLDDARGYIANGPSAMIAQHGHGLWMVQLRDSAVPIGLCGLLKRDTLEHPDIGFAFLPDYSGLGYALEAAQATMQLGRERFAMRRILGITKPDNHRSIRLLEKIGLRRESQQRLGKETHEVAIYAWQA